VSDVISFNSFVGSLLAPLPHHLRQIESLRNIGVLVVDPVMRMDAIERNTIARAQLPHQHPSGSDPSIRRAVRDVGMTAGDLNADRERHCRTTRYRECDERFPADDSWSIVLVTGHWLVYVLPPRRNTAPLCSRSQGRRHEM
jgi:hypothetical protein